MSTFRDDDQCKWGHRQTFLCIVWRGVAIVEMLSKIILLMTYQGIYSTETWAKSVLQGQSPLLWIQQAKPNELPSAKLGHSPLNFLLALTRWNWRGWQQILVECFIKHDWFNTLANTSKEGPEIMWRIKCLRGKWPRVLFNGCASNSSFNYSFRWCVFTRHPDLDFVPDLIKQPEPLICSSLYAVHETQPYIFNSIEKVSFVSGELALILITALPPHCSTHKL